MLRITSFLVAAALAFAPAPALAQATASPPAATPAPAPAPAPPDADPALWVVSDSDTTIYLFGTFHLLDGRLWFNDEIRTAFDASDELVLEAVLPDDPAALRPLVMRYAVDPNGRKLSDRLTPEQQAALNSAIAPLGLPPGAFDRFEPWFASMSLAMAGAQRLGIGAADGPEALLMRVARERGMPVGELESIEWQLRLFDETPEEQQLARLLQTLAQNDRIDEMLAPMLAAWSAGDVEGLAALIEATRGEDPELHRLLFTTRNAAWAAWIGARLDRPGAVFVAVGAGHLAGNDSVQAALLARGIAAERVPHVEAN